MKRLKTNNYYSEYYYGIIHYIPVLQPCLSLLSAPLHSPILLEDFADSRVEVVTGNTEINRSNYL